MGHHAFSYRSCGRTSEIQTIIPMNIENTRILIVLNVFDLDSLRTELKSHDIKKKSMRSQAYKQCLSVMSVMGAASAWSSIGRAVSSRGQLLRGS